MIVLKGGRLVDPRSGTDAAWDVAIDNGAVVEIGKNLRGDEVDCSGLVIAPSFVDLHVHFREPGPGDAETIESGSRAAALGGYGAVCTMANTDPAADTAEIVEAIWRRGVEAGLVDVHPIGAVTVGRRGERLAPMGEMAQSRAGVRMFSDDGDPVASAELMRRALEYSRIFDGVIIDHAEDPSMRGGHMHEGVVSTMLGVRGIPAVAEEICVQRDISLAALTGARLHIAHLTTKEGLAAVRAAKSAGVRVTAEVTPHHLVLTDDALKDYDPDFKVAPPLRPQTHVDALRAGLADGTIDAIATDHAPHAPHAKEREFDHAPCGMLGLETALAVLLAELDLPLIDIVDRFSSSPAAIAGLDEHGAVAAGRPANVVVFDPQAGWTVDASELASIGRNTPFSHRKVRGKVVHTLLRGEFVVRDGKATK